MAKIIETKAVISGEDKLAPILDKIAKKFDQIDKTAKGAKGIDKMGAAIAKIQKEMAAIDKYTVTGKGFAQARENFQRAQEAVQSAARAMREGQGDARRLEREYRRAQSAASAAARAFETQKVAAIGAKRGLDELGISGGRIVQEQNRIASAVDRASAALDRQQAAARRAERFQRLRGAIGNAATNLGFLAGPGVLHATREAVTGGAHIQSEITKLRYAGVPDAEIAAITDRSAELSAKYPNVSRSQIMERYRETRSVLTDPAETPHVMEAVIRANSALNAIDTSGHMAEGLRFAVKAAEVMGKAQKPEELAAYLNSFVKAQQVMGRTITPETLLRGAQQLKAAGALVSDRFANTTYLSLVQELGSRAGAGINQMMGDALGGFQNYNSDKTLVALGLANTGDFITSKTGRMHGFKPGKNVEGYDTFKHDPDLWVWNYLLPAMRKHGITNQSDQIATLMRIFPDKRGSGVAAKLVQQEPSFKQHATLYQNAPGTDAARSLIYQDPFVALNSFTTSLGTLASTLTSPIMERAASVLSGWASSIGQWAQSLQQWQKANPTTAGIVGGGAVAAGAIGGGVLTYNLISGLMGGFGLKTSAAALDASAAALTRAAVAIGGGSAAAAAGGGTAAGAAGRAVLGTVLGTAAGAAGIYFGSTEEANAGEQDIYRRNPATGKMELTPYGQTLQSNGGVAPVQAELRGEAKVTGEAKITIDIPGLGLRSAMVPLTGIVNANGPGSLGTSSPDAAATPVGKR